jgi:acetyl esterase/lipase
MDILSRTPPLADHRVHYGSGDSQFGDLWLPHNKAPRTHPVIAFFHGGWWQSEYDLSYAGHLCDALRNDGFAVWSIEYRRVGGTGGGWPYTFQDAAAGFEHLAQLVHDFPLDLNRVIAMGHSAGGHLAFWLAGRHHVPENSPVHNPPPRVSPHGLIALAGVVDLRLTIDLAGYFTFAHDKREVYALMGGSPADLPDRYQAGNPGDLLPLGVKQTLIQGSEDQQIPPQLPARWADKARRQGDEVDVVAIPLADHFDVVDPESTAFDKVRLAVKQMFAK